MICRSSRNVGWDLRFIDALFVIGQTVVVFEVAISKLVPIVVVAIIITIILSRMIIVITITFVAILAVLRPILAHVVRVRVVLVLAVVHLDVGLVRAGDEIGFVRGEVTRAGDLLVAGDMVGLADFEQGLLRLRNVVLAFAHGPRSHVRPRR